jgi:electron transfer flavoprotein alpha subunit
VWRAVTRAVGDALRVASLAKQVPVAESLRLEAGRLARVGVAVEMNPYCRRAVAEGVTLARDTGGVCTVITLGPPSAEDVLREAVAWGADGGLHVCDEAFAGSDTLATARALAAALRAAGPFDLVLLGRNSIDGETGQVGPELAELLDLPFASGVRRIEDAGPFLRLELEHDDGSQEVEVALPAVLTVAERLCDPCKVDPEGRAAVDPARLQRIAAADLGAGPWGEAASPTVVGATRPMEHARELLVLDGPAEEAVQRAVHELARRGALRSGAPTPQDVGGPVAGADAGATAADALAAGTPAPRTGRVVAVLAEPGRPQVAGELLAAAAQLARQVGAIVHALAPTGTDTGPLIAAGADVVIVLDGSGVAEDVSDTVAAYVRDIEPWSLLAPSTAFGREVAARAAAATGSGLVGDAIALSVREGVLVAAKPAFAGALVADITCRSATQMATVRPGVLPPAIPSHRDGTVEVRPVGTRGRIRILGERRNDDVETLARAEVVIGVGTGVTPDEYEQLSPLAAVLGAELAATRKVTDRGWAPRARQVGITGRSIAPRLYVALGLSGKFNHMVGVRGAGSILAVNADREASVFTHCDVGVVGDWHEVVPLLTAALRTGVVGLGDVAPGLAPDEAAIG